MKRFIAMLVAAITVIACACPLLPVQAAENVVYVCEGGTGDGSSDTSPLGNLTDAYNKLGDGGTIVICGSYEIKATFTEPAHANTVTVTQVYGGKDYRNGTANSVYIKSQGRRYVLAGPTTFENINFKGDTSAKYNFILFIAEFNPIIMGEGITSTDFTYTEIAKSLAILGGCQSGEGKAATISRDLDAKITVKSGKFLVVGFSRQQNASYTGCSHINIEGGEITTLYGGSVNNGSGGDTNITISGGKITGSIYVSNSNPSFLKGDAKITVTGGDFSSCKGIIGNVDGFSSIDISKHPNASTIRSVISDFDEIITEEGVSTQVSLTEAFKSGKFTDSHGTTIPYRYYLPENYDPSKSYPMVLYMHGNGSRGSDNVIHLTTNGAALNTKIYNSGIECIMLAPQCPSSPYSWVDSSAYVGSAAFLTRDSMSKHLTAAKELFDKFVAEYSVDTKRIYVTGSSNGGGATWELIFRFPNTFAAAIPLAGAGLSDGAAEVGKYLTTTPIYTFHGDADATLSVNGTRSLVKAIKDAGGTNVTYVEIPGGSHNIWSNAANTEGIVDWIFSQVNENYSPDERKYGEEPVVTEPPVTEAPATEAPATEAPATEAPVTEAPATEAPVTEAPATEAPETEAPVTEAPATEAPETEVPATEAPVTEAPTTGEPDIADVEDPAYLVPVLAGVLVSISSMFMVIYTRMRRKNEENK